MLLQASLREYLAQSVHRSICLLYRPPTWIPLGWSSVVKYQFPLPWDSGLCGERFLLLTGGENWAKELFRLPLQPTVSTLLTLNSQLLASSFQVP
jgi:hypothetical protein